MKYLVLIAFVSIFSFSALADKPCASLLKRMHYEQPPEIAPPAAQSRRLAAAATKDEEAARQLRVKQGQDFLNNQPIVQQKALATALLNYINAKADGKAGDLTEAQNLVKYQLDASKVKSNDPKNPIQIWISTSSEKDIKQVRALSRYFLSAISTKTDANGVKSFLAERIKNGDTNFGALLDNCLVDDPVIPNLLKIKI